MNTDNDKDTIIPKDNRPRARSSKDTRRFIPRDLLVGILVGAALASAIVVFWLFRQPHMSLISISILYTGIGLTIIGTLRLYTSEDMRAAAEVALGNVRLSLGLNGLILCLGVFLCAYSAFLTSRSIWLKLLSEESIRAEVAKLVPIEYREMLALAQTKGEISIPEDRRQLQRAVSLYHACKYKECVETLSRIRTNDERVLDDVLFYTIMARYHLCEERVRRYEKIPPEELKEVEGLFRRFLRERRESKRFCTVHYWLGQFYLQVCKDESAALQVFDDIVKNYAYSDWIQGSLYYSALLHKKNGGSAGMARAIRNMRILLNKDHLLKIVESNRDVDAAAVAEKLLKEWGVPARTGTTQPSWQVPALPDPLGDE